MPDPTPIVYVVDDDVLVRESLEGLIREAGWRASVFASPQEFLSHTCTLRPSCLVLDVMLPGLDGLELQQRIAENQDDIPIIFITGYCDVPTTVRAMKAGAIDFLTKPFSGDALLKTIQSALDRSLESQGAATEIKILEARYTSLSGREREVMGLVSSGLMNKQAGGELGISEVTVKAHRGRMMRKMKAGSFAELVDMAAKLRIPRRRPCRPSYQPPRQADTQACTE